MKNKIVIIAVVLILVSTGIYLFYQKQRPEKQVTLTQKKCVNEWLNKNLKADSDYRSGMITVGFKEGSIKEDNQKIIASYGDDLKPTGWSYGKAVSIEVPKGHEFEWVCKLQENPNLRYVELGGVYQLH